MFESVLNLLVFSHLLNIIIIIIIIITIVMSMVNIMIFGGGGGGGGALEVKPQKNILFLFILTCKVYQYKCNIKLKFLEC